MRYTINGEMPKHKTRKQFYLQYIYISVPLNFYHYMFINTTSTPQNLKHDTQLSLLQNTGAADQTYNQCLARHLQILPNVLSVFHPARAHTHTRRVQPPLQFNSWQRVINQDIKMFSTNSWGQTRDTHLSTSNSSS